MLIASILSINLLNLALLLLGLTGLWFGVTMSIAKNRERRHRHEERQWPRRPGKILAKRVSLKTNGCRHWLEQIWEFGEDGQVRSPDAPMNHRLARFFVDIQDVQTNATVTLPISRAEFELLVPGSVTEYAAGRYSELDEHAPELRILAPDLA